MWILLLIILQFCASYFRIKAQSINHQAEHGALRCDWSVLASNMTVKSAKDSHLIPAYYINLEDNTDRHSYMKSLLDMIGHSIGIGSNERIAAIKPGDPEFRITQLEKPCKRNTDGDLAIILSHLTAIYRAVKDKSPIAQRSPYALVLEDDAAFNIKADLRRVIDSAPKDFGLLQLATTNTEALESLWEKYTKSGHRDFWTLNEWSQTTKNGKYTLYWGALGYLVQKSVVEPFLDDVIEVDAATGKLSFKIINSFFPQKCSRTKARPCILANCLFSDSYLYSGAGPTYVANFPLLTSGQVVGLNSTVHQAQVPAHVEAFNEIEKMTMSLRSSLRYNRCLKRGEARHAHTRGIKNIE